MRGLIVLCILLVLAFLSAAKSHGRQHRLERELHGHWTVSFTSKNHPWVERFWYRQRVIYWSLASLSAALMITGAVITRRPRRNLYAIIGFAIPGSMIIAFTLTGLWSAMRLAIKLGQNTPVPSAEWLRSAIWGSLGFWLLTGITVTLLILSARKWFVISFQQ